ncbi:MAG: hypothetical protein NW214_03305 [Pseudanabaenaceae cyanobacterium bins.39]|nr:hypothetical protein [Pseudanabaenaceae cyanobacterium bins.39]
MSNIFLIPASTDKRQRFAYFWEYLLENVSELGQEFVDFVTQRSGKASSQFLSATSYPHLSDNLQPDLLIECQDFNIICDHRLDSDILRQSLEDMLLLAHSQPKLTYVVIVSNCYCFFKQEVLTGDLALRLYLQPKDNLNSAMPYFCWQDIYAIVAQHPERLAHEFAEYMHFMDMQPWQHSIWGELFTNPEVAMEFSKQWAPTLAYFQNLQVTNKLSGYSAVEIIYPQPWLQLLYIYASRSVQHSNLVSVSPYLVATVWIKGDEREIAHTFHGISEQFVASPRGYEDRHIEIEVYSSLADGLWAIKNANRPKLAASYYTSLDRIVSSDRELMQQNLLAFAEAVFTHAQRVAHVH